MSDFGEGLTQVPEAQVEAPTARWRWVDVAAYGGWALAGLTLALGYLLPSRSWFFMLMSFLAASLGLLSVAAPQSARRWTRWARGLSGVALGGLILLAAIAVWSVVAPAWALLTSAFAVVGWDATHFRRRLPETTSPALRRLQLAHLRRLLLTVGLGTVVGGLALIVEVGYHFGVLLLLALVAVFGLSRAIAYLRRESD